MNNMYEQNPHLQKIFHKTKIVKKSITGIVSGYHELPYIFISPDDEDSARTLETFDEDIQERLFSFAYGGKKNLKIESEYFQIKSYHEKPDEHISRVHDDLLMQENVRTGLIFGPQFKYYPVSLDRFINEIVDREFNV